MPLTTKIKDAFLLLSKPLSYHHPHTQQLSEIGLRAKICILLVQEQGYETFTFSLMLRMLTVPHTGCILGL
jgi:hypothetical protein